MVGVIVICFYIFMNLDKLNNVSIPVSDKVIEYFKQEPFNTNLDNSTTTSESY